MKIITIATQKGGAGKTTLATNLAVASAMANKITLLIDADAGQKTALEWFQKREDQNNPLVMEASDQNMLFKLLIRRLGKNGAFIITKAQARGQEAKETRIILSGLGFGSPEQQTTNLKVYKDAAICSLSVLEYDPKSKAAEEIKVLFKWI